MKSKKIITTLFCLSGLLAQSDSPRLRPAEILSDEEKSLIREIRKDMTEIRKSRKGKKRKLVASFLAKSEAERAEILQQAKDLIEELKGATTDEERNNILAELRPLLEQLPAKKGKGQPKGHKKNKRQKPSHAE